MAKHIKIDRQYVQSEHTPGRVVWRFVSGAHLDGRARTDATAFKRATTVVSPTGRASKWSHLSRAERSAWRLGTLGTVVSGTVGYVTHPLATEVAASSAAAGGIAYGGYRVRITLKQWNRRRKVIQPLARALSPIVELTETQVFDRLEVPEKTDQPDSFVKVPLPDHYAGRVAQMADVTRIVSQRIGGEWDTAWQLKQSPFYIHFTPKPAPPRYVSYADVRDAILRSDIHHPVLGLGSRGEIVKLNFKQEIAHLAGSVGTGGGKSSFLRGQLAQDSYHGCDEFHVFDTKFVSLAGCEVIPGVNIYKRVEDIFDGWAYVRAEMDRRYDVLDKDPSATFPLMSVFAEEQNAFALEASVWWRENKPKGEKRNRPPVWTDIALTLLKARQVNIRVRGMYQYLNADACGGMVEIRGQYGQKLIGRFDPQAWDLLVGTKPRANSSNVQGRVILIGGGEQRSVQLPDISVEDAVELAMSRPRRHVTVGRETRPQVTIVSQRDVTDSVPAEPIPAGELRYTLPEACRAGIIPLTADNARQIRARDRRKPENERRFPIGIPNDSGEETYTASELAYWYETRPKIVRNQTA